MIDIVFTNVVNNAKVSGIAVSKYNVASARMASPNIAPVVQRPEDIVLKEVQSFKYQLIASDPDGDAMAFTSKNLPASLWLDQHTGLIHGTIEKNAGTFPVTVTVFDKRGLFTNVN